MNDLSKISVSIIFTNSPSIVIWSITRKCLVGGLHQPPALELYQEENGKHILGYKNNRFVTLLNHKLTSELIETINKSNGIIVSNTETNNLRFGFIPEN